MKKVRYNNRQGGKAYLTYNKVYDVIDYIPNTKSKHLDLVMIMGDDGHLITYFSNLFVDATSESRNKVIDDILK